MSSLDNAVLQGEEKKKAVDAINKQISEWKLTLPNVDPLPLHFGLDNFYEVGETEFWLANENDFGYCGKFLFVFDGQTCPYHQHKVKHETFFVIKGKISMNCNGEIREMSQGDRLVMPTGVAHSFTGIGPALILEVSMPSIPHDSFFADHNIGDNGVL